MALSNEDYNDVKRTLGKSEAKKISRVTNDAKSRALKVKSSDEKIGFTRLLKTKEDYSKMHLKGHVLHAKKDGRSDGLKKTVTRSEWNKTHNDYKGNRDFGGVKKHPYKLQLDENGATVYSPVKIRPENKGKTYIHPK